MALVHELPVSHPARRLSYRSSCLLEGSAGSVTYLSFIEKLDGDSDRRSHLGRDTGQAR